MWAQCLLPYWIGLIQHPIRQIPIPHDSRANFLLNSITAVNYFVIPYGALILALPFLIIRGSSSPRLRPLMFGFWLTFLFGLGGTTPVPRWLLGRAYDILTFERFTFWATLMALPIVGLIVVELLDRYAAKAAVALSLAAVTTLGMALAWLTANPYRPLATVDVGPVVDFLNRDGHDGYRYLTLGFGSDLAKVSTYTNAGSVDGDYNSARLLPEMTRYGSAQLTNAKFYGIGWHGIASGNAGTRQPLWSEVCLCARFILRTAAHFRGISKNRDFRQRPGHRLVQRRCPPGPQNRIGRDARALGRLVVGHSSHGGKFPGDFP